MDEAEDVCFRGIFCEGGYNSGVGSEVARRGAFKRPRFDIEDIDKDADRGEDVGLLGCEVGFCEGILPAGCFRLVYTDVRAR